MANSGGGYSYVFIRPINHRGKVLKSKINNIAFTNVLRCFKEKFKKNDLKVTHHCRLVCQEKEKRRKNRVLEECNMPSQIIDQGSSPLIVESIDRLKHKQRRHYKYIYKIKMI